MTSRRRMMAGANLTSKGVVGGVIQDDWDQIIKICKSGKADQFYSIGDKIRLYCTLGGYLNRKMGTAIFFD